MQKVKLTLYVIGARRGTFKNDDGDQVKYAAVFANDDVHASAIMKGDAFGQVPQKIRADYEVIDQLRHVQEKLPAYCEFEGSLDFNVTGDSKVKLLCSGLKEEPKVGAARSSGRLRDAEAPGRPCCRKPCWACGLSTFCAPRV